MHKGHVAIVALVLAAVVTGLVALLPDLKASKGLDVLYLPTAAVAILLSGSSHAPAAWAWNSSFVLYSVVYLVVFVVCYALLLEFYLVRQALRHLDAVREDIRRNDAYPELYLRRLGAAIGYLEARRRHHFVLKGRSELDPSREPRDLAVSALTTSSAWKPMRRLMDGLQSRIAAELGKERAATEIRQLREYASNARSAATF